MHIIQYVAVVFLISLQFISAEALSTPNQSNGLSHYYLAYGSNLSYDFLKERLKNGNWIDEWHKNGELEGPIPQDLGTFKLFDYEFSYSLNVEPFGETGTAANVQPKKGSIVYGALYKLSDAQLLELDKTEDVQEAYVRIAVKVHKCAEAAFEAIHLPDQLTAWVYVGNPKYVVQDSSPDPLYVDLLVRSAYERSFPPNYIEECLQKLSPVVCSH